MLDAFIRREMADKQLPGLAVALVEGSRIIWRQGYGFSDPTVKTPITADTVFRVGSVSKLFTDIAVMQLVEQGKLDLDAPVTKYLSEFKPRNSFNKPVTLRQLMSHRSGLVREPPVGNYFDSNAPTLAATVDSLNQTALVYVPETHVKYSNAGIASRLRSRKHAKTTLRGLSKTYAARTSRNAEQQFQTDAGNIERSG